MKIVVGIDETGTEKQLCDGWCFFGFPENDLNTFNNDCDALKVRHKIKGFHAKEYKSSQSSAYTEFLQLIERYIVSCPVSICSSFLYRKDWNKRLHEFSENVFSGSTASAGIENPESTKVAKKFLPPLLSLIQIGKGIGKNNDFEVHFDSDNIKQQIDSHELCLTPEISLSLRNTIGIVANKYRDLNFQNAPTVVESHIQVLDDEKSNIIQAADVIGNFSTNYIFNALGSAMPKRIEKAKIFASVFGKYLSGVNFGGIVKLNGDNDLELLGNAAALPFIMGRL